MPPLSRSQVDRLGERLGSSEYPDPADLDLLDEFERSFEPAQSFVISLIRERLRLDPTARTETVHSVVAKVRRERTALSRMQDIAGCRLVVADLVQQGSVVEHLCELPWDGHRVFDRRATPSHGYRAVHVVATTMGRHVEVQVRTILQDLWAQVSEKMADRFGLEVKYGGGPAEGQALLAQFSADIAMVEELRDRVRKLEDALHSQLTELMGTLAR